MNDGDRRGGEKGRAGDDGRTVFGSHHVRTAGAVGAAVRRVVKLRSGVA